jgi:hypothetical protein
MPKPKPPQTPRRFVVVSKAICETTITATTAKAAIAEWKRRQKHCPRLRWGDCVIQLLADPPACLDVERGTVTQHVEKATARHKWAGGKT